MIVLLRPEARLEVAKKQRLAALAANPVSAGLTVIDVEGVYLIVILIGTECNSIPLVLFYLI